MTVLHDHDFLPLAEFAFQHWDQRSGPAFEDMRPLREDAARRVWRRACELAAVAWADVSEGRRFDLQRDSWDADTVRLWLGSLGPQDNSRIIVCFQPQAAITVSWASLCEHWLVLLWTGGCAWPASEEWVLVHDGEQFAFATKS